MQRRSILRAPLSLLMLSPPVARADEAILKRLASMPPNHGLRLGEARLVGDFNEVARRFDLHKTGPRSRDFCRKMAWAPERQRALFAGANHGSPHRLNDVWEFDLAAMAWTLLYAPDNPRTYGGLGPDASDVVFRDGVVQKRRGGPATAKKEGGAVRGRGSQCRLRALLGPLLVFSEAILRRRPTPAFETRLLDAL